MRILFLTETVPFPLDSGGRIKTYHALRMLAGAHDVRVHAFIRDEAQRAHLPHLDTQGVVTTLHLVPRSLPREAWFALRSLAGAQIFCRIRGYLSTMRKQGHNALTVLTSVFDGKPTMPQLTA